MASIKQNANYRDLIYGRPICMYVPTYLGACTQHVSAVGQMQCDTRKSSVAHSSFIPRYSIYVCSVKYSSVVHVYVEI